MRRAGRRPPARPTALAAIRLAAPADAPALAVIYAPAVVGSAISFEVEPPAAGGCIARRARAARFVTP